MADGHHKSDLFFLGCGEEKEPTEARNDDLKPSARTEKYITSIMDEESSNDLDEAGIPMLVSRYIENNFEAQKEEPVGYIEIHCVYHKGLEGTQIWNILLG